MDALAGDDEVYGLAGNDLLEGGSGYDYLEGDAGNDILRGGADDDDIEDWEGSNVLEGGAGDDYLYADGGSSFMTGGTGADYIDAWGPNSVVAFNRGDGNDVLDVGTNLTLSLGGGILPGDLMLSRAGDDFILDFGSGDAIQITRPAWLDQPAFSPITLQIVGGDVRWFDLNATIADFMQLQAQDSGIVSWNAGDALAAHALGNSNDRAYGGRLAVDYARSGSLDAMPPDAIRAVISDADFGAVPQSMVTNHAPVAVNAVADQLAAEDALFRFAVPADTFSDIDAGDTLRYSATLSDGSALPSWLAFDEATRSFSGTPVNADVGSLSLTLTVTDQAGERVASTFAVVIANVNDAPVVANAIQDLAATEDATFSFVVPADAFADIDAGDSLGYAATREDGSALPSWLSFDAVTRAFSGTPTNSDVGSLSITVKATDVAGASVSQQFSMADRNSRRWRHGDSRSNLDRQQHPGRHRRPGQHRLPVAVLHGWHDLERHQWRYRRQLHTGRSASRPASARECQLHRWSWHCRIRRQQCHCRDCRRQQCADPCRGPCRSKRHRGCRLCIHGAD